MVVGRSVCQNSDTDRREFRPASWEAVCVFTAWGQLLILVNQRGIV